MLSGDLIREARLRAGLTQAELGERIGQQQSVVARWERGAVVPSWRTFGRPFEAAASTSFHLSKLDESTPIVIDEHLRMTPAERFADLLGGFVSTISCWTANRYLAVPEVVPYRPDVLLEVLERHGVRYVVIGGLAAELRGSPYITRDVDVTPSRERANLRRLAAALRELNATLRVPGVEGPVEFPLDEHSFTWGTSWTFVTDHGYLNIALLLMELRAMKIFDAAQHASRSPRPFT